MRVNYHELNAKIISVNKHLLHDYESFYSYVFITANVSGSFVY